MRTFPKQASSGTLALLVAASVLLMTGCFVSENPAAPRQTEDDGEFALKVRMGVRSVTALGKSSVITLSKLNIVITSSANDTIRDSVLTPTLSSVSTTGQNVSRNYDLKALRSWKFVAISRDVNDSIIHRDSAIIPAMYAGDTAVVNLNLSSRYSMYEAKFLSLPDSIESATPNQPKQKLNINRLVLKIDGVIVSVDSTPSPGPYFAPSVEHKLEYDYVSLGSKSLVASGTAQHLHSIVFPSADTGFAVGAGGVALRTLNGGASWSPMAGTGTRALYSVYFLNATTGWMAGDSVIYRTTNAGASWQIHSGSVPVTRVVHFFNASTGFSVNTGGTVRRSTNAGENWSIHSGVNAAYGTHFVSTQDTGWVVGNLGGGSTCFKTTNSGNLWSAQTMGTSRPLRDVFAVNGSLVYAVGDSGTIRRTVDGGVTTWVSKPSGTLRNLKSVHFLDAATGFVVGDSGTILSTSDSGNTWTAESSPTSANLTAITFFGGKGYVVGENGTLIALTGPRQVEMLAYGPMGNWNVALPLYSGSKYINAIPGIDATMPLILQWTGPTTGTGSLTAQLGRVGKITINGTLPGTVGP